MKRQSISSRINIVLVLISVSVLIFSLTVIVLVNQIKNATKEVTTHDMPAALNTLAMLEELGDMNSNLLEYVLGEPEEKQEYFGNYDEFNRFKELIPTEIAQYNDIKRVTRIVNAHKEQAQSRVFAVYSPYSEALAAEQIQHLITNVGEPLERLLDELKEEEIADVGSVKDLNDVINDDLPGVRFYLELTDEAGDMLSDLDRFVMGNLDARGSFFANALQFASFLEQLKPLELKPQEIIRINEIERLFNELKSGGEKVFVSYSTQTKKNAMQAIDDLEHQSFTEAEKLLDALSSEARENVNRSMVGLGNVANHLVIVLVSATVLIVTLTFAMTIYTRKMVFIPLKTITKSIDKLRVGERDFELEVADRNDELSDVLVSLQQLKLELCELDDLRERKERMQKDLMKERDTATTALSQLKDTQEKLVSNEKMASLGNLVAGVAHEVNTPLGVSVTVSTTIAENMKGFLEQVKSGALKRSSLDNFEVKTQEALTILDRSLEQASHLIHNFKQVAVDQTSSKRRSFNLAETVDEITSTLHHQITRTNINFVTEGDNDIVMDSYPGPLGQVITNLFNNAMLHAFDGREEGEINIRFSLVGDKVRFLFSDNGLGIAESNLNQIFDPFYTTKLGEGGSGLGLNIVHNIVSHVLGGSINVESHVGTTFEMMIPIVAPSSKEASNV
ncbi:sensor histidine kinase [Psychrobium sp. 1_MG-2023]|uniref:sensor histidine kinase n=1 Tax=Psychrobium sp. 1_MG-2023 TaxID=3062624 RepID=UPI002732D447|nr:ATP-binding protein [Psychrobium sp. 1_MG-2023]MDP2560789.1 ATP-binding protein [Psychrobium sp. 1_MG-2023]